MTKIFKLAGCALMLSGFCVNEAHANCPELNQAELRRLCRWEGFKALGIKAGSVEKNGVTLTNTLGTCGEGDSIKEFITKKSTTMYHAVLTKDPAAPNNLLKGLCTYTIGREKIAFNIQLPPKTLETSKQEEPTPQPQPTRKDPRTMGGVDITTSPHIKQVPVEKHPSLSPTRPEPASLPTGSGHPDRPLPAHLNPTSQPMVRGFFQEPLNVSPGSKPPLRALPVPPVQPKAEQNKPLDIKSELEQRLGKRKLPAEQGTVPLRHPPEPTYGAG